MSALDTVIEFYRYPGGVTQTAASWELEELRADNKRLESIMEHEGWTRSFIDRVMKRQEEDGERETE